MSATAFKRHTVALSATAFATLDRIAQSGSFPLSRDEALEILERFK